MVKRRSRFWFKNEKELMSSLGMKGTPGSGNRIIKEDGQNEYLIAQLKSTDKSSITINLTDINTLLYNATVAHKLPLFINQFIGGPVLISMRLEDVVDVAKYLETGVCQGPRFCDIIAIAEERKPRNKPPLVRSGGREAVRAKLAQARELEYQKRLEERKRKKWGS